MGTSNYSDAFKPDAVAPITERGYPVQDVLKRGRVDHEAENRRL